jgi:hypothetical protein
MEVGFVAWRTVDAGTTGDAMTTEGRFFGFSVRATAANATLLVADGNGGDVLADVGVAVDGDSDTVFFGPQGIRVENGVHVTSSNVSGVVYVSD